MNSSPIQRINPAAQWSDAVVHNGTAYFVEVPESGTDITSQSQAVFAQAERTLALAGSNKSRLLIATIYLKHMADRTAFNAAWQAWLPEGCAPARVCVCAPRWPVRTTCWKLPSPPRWPELVTATTQPPFQASADSLDPTDWSSVRQMGHRMLDDMVDMLAGLRETPVWQPMPPAARQALRSGALPTEPGDLDAVYEDFQTLVQPYGSGNSHPRFMGWVQGGGNPVGMLAELLAAATNPNLGGRDHAPIEVERQVIRWAAEMLGFPLDASGVLVTGTSMANLIAVLVARTRALGTDVRRTGLQGHRLVAYTSVEAHNCVARAIDMAGLGSDALRLIGVDAQHRIDLHALQAAIAQDTAAGLHPFMVVGCAGTVDTGAVDDLSALAALARTQGLWFHVDAAYGALAMLSPAQRPLLQGLSEADSVAFDFHKWAQVPYDAGCIVVRDAALHAATFASQPAYLQRSARGLAGNLPWPTDFGPDLSRGFRALKVWMTLKTYGAAKLGQVVAQNCSLAQQLAHLVDAQPQLERLAPVTLNVVCFRVLAPGVDLDTLNADIVADVQESGIAVPSTTRIGGVLAIRVALVNHRTRLDDVQMLLGAVLLAAQERLASSNFQAK